jgi:hypothetical protein
MLLTDKRLKGSCNGILARAQLGLHNSLLVHEDTSLSLLSVKQITYHKTALMFVNMNIQINEWVSTTIMKVE